MKLWVLAGMFTAVTVPFAAASESAAECEVDDTRRAVQVRIENGPPGGSAATTARPTIAPRDPTPEMAQRDVDDAQRRAADRRRSGKPIPDAELIGPRRAL